MNKKELLREFFILFCLFLVCFFIVLVFNSGRIKENKPICVESKTRCNNDILQICKNGAWEITKNCLADKKICKTKNSIATCELNIPKGMVLVEGGEFRMGSNISGSYHNDEHPIHQVRISSFYISKYEVTNAEFSEFLNSKGRTKGNYNGKEVSWIDIDNKYCEIEKKDGKYVPKEGRANYPVVKVSWYGANAYSKWKGGRLPTEAEWEYAARGGQKSKGYKYSGSDNIDEVAWYKDNSKNSDNNMYEGRGTHEVGTKKPNELGIYDMSGNVWEWVSDWYNKDYYKNSPYENPQGPALGSGRVFRGGGWLNNADYCHVAYRNYGSPSDQYNGLGFRFARPL